MALLEITRTAYHVGSAADRAVHAAYGAFGRFAAWNDARRTRRVLGALSAHELNDIGLTGADIDTIARRGRV